MTTSTSTSTTTTATTGTVPATGAPLRRPPGGNVRRAAAYEWIRLRSLRSTKWAVGWTAALAVLFGVSLGMDVRSLPDGASVGTEVALQNLTVAAELTGMPLIGLVMGILGIVSVTHEHRYGTIRPAFVAVPRRSDVLLGKTLVMGAAAAAVAGLGLVLTAFTAAAVSLGGLFTALPPLGGPALALLCYVLVVVLCTVAGMALGSLTRSTGIALSLWLVVPFVGETAVYVALHAVDALEAVRGAANWMPFRAAQKAVASSDPGALTRLGGTAAFAAWTGALSVVAGRAVVRRDV
ncbi:ABC transporter permease subunit [Streptomyces sp. NPDC012888]|uniref:ABC transporter permease subunit n=1 Tax=Streptomyces sp. NPDC012888 TaxID=3364855 RepID=UPI0036C040E3